ncbi:hypothetical protein FDZ74_09885, partial [bacterium]
MKNKRNLLLAAAAAGGLAIALARRRRVGQMRTAAWQNQFRPALDVLACPNCRRPLEMILLPGEGEYRCLQ